MTDYLLWKNDIDNRYTAILSHVTSGGGYIATAVISSVTTNSSFRMSLWDAWLDLRNKILNLSELDGAKIIPISTTTQRDALSGIIAGTTIYNKTIDEDETYTGTSWVAAGGEQGDIVHLAAGTETTTDNTQTACNTVTLDADAAYLFTAEIIGETSDHGTVAGFVIQCTAKRTTSGSAALVGSVTTVHSGKDSGASSWGATFTVSGNDVRVSITGANSTTVNWECDLNYLKHS